MSAPDRPTREEVARSIAGRIDWTPTVLAGRDPRESIVEQVLRLAEYETHVDPRAGKRDRARWASWLDQSADEAGDLSDAERLGLRVAATHLLDVAVATRVSTIDLDADAIRDLYGRLWAKVDSGRAALMARTPQPARPPVRGGTPWRVVPEGRPPEWKDDGYAVVTADWSETTDRAEHYVAERMARETAELLAAAAGSDPLPAVPDGEGARPLAESLIGMCDEAETLTATHPVYDDEGRARAPYLTTSEVRAAVAAALCRPVASDGRRPMTPADAERAAAALSRAGAQSGSHRTPQDGTAAVGGAS